MHENLHSLLELCGQRGFPDASELHGLLCAHACVDSSADHAACARELLRWLGANAQQQKVLQACTEALQMTTAELLDPAGKLQPWLPDDACDLHQRTEALAAWAGGFVSGLGVHGDVELGDIASEALADLQQIARVSVAAQANADQANSDQANADQANTELPATATSEHEALEQAYTELVEYTRVAMALIHHALLAQQPTATPAVLH